VIYKEIADMAAERIKTAITLSLVGENPVKAILDAYNPTGSTSYVNFTTSKELRWQTDPRKCHVNWVVCDSDWEAEFCRVAEAHPKVRAYVKNQNLGLEVPYLMGSTPRRYLPDFILRLDDGRADPLNLVVEIKGFRGENAKDKANTMRAYWVPGVNNLGKFGRWAFAEFTAVYEIEAEFDRLIENKTSPGARQIESQTAPVEIRSYADARNLSQALVREQFGFHPSMSSLCELIWRRIEENPEHAIWLADVGAAAETVACVSEDALALLALLSGRAGRLLKIRLNRMSADHSNVSDDELIRRLSAWLREKTMSDSDWKAWASEIEVKWVPAFVAHGAA